MGGSEQVVEQPAHVAAEACEWELLCCRLNEVRSWIVISFLLNQCRLVNPPALS
jgi:hypothetical protein